MSPVGNAVPAPWRNQNRPNGEYPVTKYEWGIPGEVLPEATDFHTTVRREFSVENVRASVEKGDASVKPAGSLDDALFHLQNRYLENRHRDGNSSKRRRTASRNSHMR